MTLWGGTKRERTENVKTAIACFEKSLEKRTPGGNQGHDWMRKRIVECVTALKAVVRERESAVAKKNPVLSGPGPGRGGRGRGGRRAAY